MADYTQILYEKQRNGVLITLNRPEAMNAISGTLQVELHAALDAAVADPEIRAIVLTGAGVRLLVRHTTRAVAGGERRCGPTASPRE